MILIGVEAYKTRVPSGLARHFRGLVGHFCGLPRRFEGPGHGPAHVLSRKGICADIFFSLY